MKNQFKSGFAAMTCVLVLGFSHSLNAQQVSLEANDGSVTIGGKLIDYDGETYTLETLFGKVSVDALTVNCIGDACPNNEKEQSGGATQTASMVINGETDLIGSLIPGMTVTFARELGAKAQQDAPNANVVVVSGSDERLIELSAKATDVDTAFNDLRAGEANLLLTRKKSDTTSGKVIALDGVVVITSKNNPMRAISERALADVFSGRVTNWSQIGLPNAPIRVLTPSKNSAASELFADTILSSSSSNIVGTAIESNEQLLAAVESDPLAIAFTNYSTAKDAKIVDIRGECGIQVSPSGFNIQTEEYPLTQRVYAYSNVGNNAVSKRFVDFLVSGSAQKTVEESSLIDLNPHLQSNNEQGLRYLSAILPVRDGATDFNALRNLANQQISADRMSITFRFDLGSSKLDERALEDVNRLAEVLTKGNFENKEVKLIGFTDSIGSPTKNLALSKRRAAYVLEQLRAAAPAASLNNLDITADGFGEVSPVACNDTLRGQAINRRVEVWVKDKVQQSN